MEAEKSSPVVRDLETPKKDIQMRVTPSEVKFLDALAGRVYRLPVTVHNLGRSNQKIRFQEPVKPQFKLILTNLDKTLASGLQTTAMVEYHPDKNEDMCDQLLISVGNKTIEIPLIGFLNNADVWFQENQNGALLRLAKEYGLVLIPSCQLEIEPEVNFGTLVAGSKVYCKEISIINHGSVPGIFKIEYQSQLPIVIFPTSGVVQPKSSMVIKVDFCADQPIVVNEYAKVSLQDRPDIFLNIRAHVVEQIIELLNINNDEKLECISFGSVFFGTSKIERALLYNNSPEPINWVAIMQDDSVGEELGTNIKQRTDVALNNLAYLRKIKSIDITTIISCVPNEGRLITDGQKNDPTHRQDYAIFLRFESAGTKDGFLRNDNQIITSDSFQKVELALTGSGLPVLLQFDPGRVLTFAPCFMGGHSEIHCVMQNRSKSLPLMYHFKKTAHFKVDPQKGKIDEGCIQNVTCSFIPHQVGVFKVKQFIEIIGSVADENLQSSSLKPFHQIYLYFNSVCKPSTKKVVMKINPGLSPLVSNPTGQFVVKDLVQYKDHAPVAMLQSTMTHIHNHKIKKELKKGALIAFPNDRAASIRSGEDDKNFRTIFTKIPRYNYVDPDFAYTKFEKIEKKSHEKYYAGYIKYLRNVRLQKEAHRKCIYSYNDIDIGLHPASGLKSPTVSEVEMEEELSPAQCWIKHNQLLCTRNIAFKETKSLRRKVLKGLKSHPSTPHEKHDCSLILTPKQIYQVIVGPSVLNFGDVCVNSTNTHLLHIINMLPIHILIQLDVSLEELQKTNQFSYVIPPTTSTSISMIFESPTIGKFWKSFAFTVNNMPGGHILVMAVVLPVRLELSSNELILRPQGFLEKSCFRGTVRMYNHQNYFVKFKWQPINTGKGMAFSIRPAKGTVEPYSSLECEVTWQPGFDSPERGEFILHVTEGNTLTLKCLAHLGHSKVTFLEPRILFSNSPQGLTTWRKAILHNVGQNHAYFKICDQNLLSMIKIVPSQGIIPLGGLTVLNISCTPTVKEKFDTRAKVAIRRANDIDLRIGGSVEVADIEIHPNRFNFSGTYIGATHIMPFLVKNKGITRARVEFNMEDADGFSLDFEGKTGIFTNPASPNIFFLDLEKETSVECDIAFSPKEVATYNFTMQVRVNFFAASELDSQCRLSDSNVIPNRRPDIQLCYIQATVLRAPLTLSSTYFIFEIPLHTLDPNGGVTKTQNLVLHNTSRKDVEWKLDIRNTDKLFKDGIFKFSTLSGALQPNEECNVAVNFCPKQPGEYTADIPMRLNDNPICYRMLHLLGEIKSPKLLFVPPFIFFNPVPLDVPAVMDVNILPQNYFRNSTLSVRISPAKLLDGNEIQPLSVSFPKGRVIVGSSFGINASLPCRLSFKSSKSVSLFTHVLFCDSRNNWFSLPVTATAENCMLTIYSYMAIHLDEQKIIVKYEKDASSVKAESKSLLASRETGLPSTAPGKCSGAEPAKRKLFVGMEIIPERLKSSKYEMPNKGNRFMKKEAKDKEFFSPKEGTRTYDFFLKTINAVQTWFSLFGWPEGPHSLRIPETVRRDVYKIQVYSSALSAKKFSRQSDFSKYNKTIYDVLVHLCGKMPPGINSSQSLPVDYPERVIQLHCQHSLLLEFLSAQGACISHVLPEFLLEPEDYKKWIEIASSTSASAKLSHIPKGKHSVVIDMIHFEAWSKRSWTDVFLQIYKVLVLSRVVPYSINNLPPIHVQNSPKVNAYFASSNIYSTPERILLSWMNTIYENYRHVIWKNCQKGVIIPPEKWIVNFDKDLLDGLVFATVLGAYCPFLIESHFIHMYTQPKSSEQYLHNCLIVVNVLREIGFDMAIQAADICDPNPILMLMFCVYMYERLPTYLPKKVVPFHCTLHDTVFREIQLKNPSLKSLVYTATIVGRDASDFSLSQAGNTVTISAKNQITITLKFTSRFLHPAEASLLLISRPKKGIGGTTMTFALKGEVLNFKAIAAIKCKSPCYTWQEITVKVKNPFQASGDFNVILVESSTFISLPSQLTEVEESVDFLNRGVAVNSSGCDIPEDHPQDSNALKTSIKSNFIKEFFCSTHTLHLAARGTSSLELIFLPFGMHTRYCVIILSNREIGELIYILEGRGIIPLPSRFIPMDSSTPLEFGSSPEEVLTKDDPVLYLKCKLQQILDVDLKLPLTNEAKEKALAFAAQQQMSKIEYERRLLTGTLESSSIRVAIALLGLTKIEMCMLLNVSKLKKPKSILYKAELSLPEHFDIPKTVCIPQIPETQVDLAQYQGNKPAGRTAAARSVPVPLRFVPLSPGRYPCKILLTSRYDVRLYCIEGVVNEERPEARFYFETPAFEPLTQNIPVNNETMNEWKCQATIEGEWFHGPPILYVGPGETVDYPLTFKPILECEIMGRLILQNEVDGMEHVFDIKGIGKRPLALEYITVDCQVGEVTNKHIIVPNYTPSVLTFKVSSDLPIVWGNPDITIDPGNTVPYILHVCPWKRGIFKGTVTFSVKSKHDGDSQEDSDEDQDGDQIPFYKKSLSELSDKFDEEKPDNAINNLRVWYHLEIHSVPGPPLKIIDMQCVAMESVCIEVPLINPKEKIIHFDVLFSSAAFSGLDELELFPRGSVNYIVRYSPACAGFTEESIVFQPDSGLEFWYLLKITTDLPEPTIMKEIYCDLGKAATEMISLDNPTCETLELHATNSNTENFVLEIKRLPLIIPPNSSRDIPIHFRPSALGRASHQTSVTFHCAQVDDLSNARVIVGEGNGTPLQYSCLENPMDGGAWWAAVHEVAKSRTRLSDFTFTFHFDALEKEMATHSSVLAWRIPGTGEPSGLLSMGSHRFKEWIFLLSGIGLFPQPHEIQKVTASLHLQTSVPIPFQNPTKEEVFIDIILTGEEKPKRLVMAQIWDSFLEETSAFKISGVTHTKGIAVPPKGTLDIQVLFMPQVMKLQKTMVLIQMRKASGKRWLIDNFTELHPEVKRGLGLDSEEILEIRWIYPIIGLPQAPPPENSEIVIKCQARKRLEEEVEVTLDGDFGGKNPILYLSDFIVIPKRKSYSYYEDIDDVPMKHEFEYDIEFESEVEDASLESCVAIYLIKKSYNAKNEQITLVFNLIFTPKKPVRSQVTLKVECTTDGIWTFPIMLIATEPDVDEVIDIEGVGLFKESTVNLRLTSQARNPESFTANFLPGSDPEFFVKPQIGELLPEGTLITVGFIPTMYSREYKATLAIQTADMYWLYEINGLPQVSVLPVNVKAKVDAHNKVFDKKSAHRRNFLYENAQLTRTGVSSTIKGAPLVLKNK